jgi:chemotaxis protein methyltransferase CheR
MLLVSCRNMPIHFDRPSQDRSLGLFLDAIVRGGPLGLGAHETLRFLPHAEAFGPFAEAERIWRHARPARDREVGRVD